MRAVGSVGFVDWSWVAPSLSLVVSVIVAVGGGAWAVIKWGFAGFRAEMNARFDAVDQRFDAVDQRFDAVDQRFERLERSVGETNAAVRYVGEQVSGAKERIARIEGALGMATPDPEQA